MFLNWVFRTTKIIKSQKNHFILLKSQYNGRFSDLSLNSWTKVNIYFNSFW